MQYGWFVTVNNYGLGRDKKTHLFSTFKLVESSSLSIRTPNLGVPSKNFQLTSQILVFLQLFEAYMESF